VAEVEMKHTPGPWRIVPGDDYMVASSAYPSEKVSPVVRDNIGPFVALIGNQSGDCGEANAQLIAAAPDMLAALKAIAEPLEGIRDDQASHGLRFGQTQHDRAERQRIIADWIRGNADKVDTALEIVFAAIARAEGTR
jgi:hypothetical protein